MRIALISDIHGNFTAFEAVLADIEQQQVDSIICLGDVAVIGPQPRQVLSRLKTLGCSCVMGNHEASLLNPDAVDEYIISPLVIPAEQWCNHQLDKEDLDYLRSFQPLVSTTLGTDANMLCFHGSPQSNMDFIFATTPEEEVDTLLDGQIATIMAAGHTHLQMVRQHNGTLIVNPGSVGMAFREFPSEGITVTLLPWASYAIVNSVQSTLSVELRRVPFDVEAFSEVIAGSDIPMKDWWLYQY